MLQRHNQLYSNNLQVLVPSNSSVKEKFFEQSVLPVFSTEAAEFVDHFSRLILTDADIRQYPELVAMAFWMRKANIQKMEQDYKVLNQGAYRLARGVVFHIAPSNVDSIFIYSWFLSLLAGNINIVRLSSKRNEQVSLLLKMLNLVCSDQRYNEVVSRQKIITYEHNDETTGYFSEQCDVRVIWGGDATIHKIRSIPLPPTSIELPFADKFSLCLVNASEYLNIDTEKRQKLAINFINDAYWFGQMACSSPRLVVWMGEKEVVELASGRFWDEIEKSLDRDRTGISAADIVNKLVSYQSMAIESDIEILESSGNLVNRVLLKNLGEINHTLHCGAGLFYEHRIQNIGELLPVLSRKYQTLSVFGVSSSEIETFILDGQPKGIDRVVPVGKALDFSVRWDGYNLLQEYTRNIEVELSH